MIYNINFIDMPCKTKANVVKNEDDTYSIFINAKLNYEQQYEALNHELAHINNTDFEKQDVEEIEIQNH